MPLRSNTRPLITGLMLAAMGLAPVTGAWAGDTATPTTPAGPQEVGRNGQPKGPLPAPAPTPAPTTTEHATSADAALRETLPNGLRVVIVPDRLAPVVTTEINYLAGSNDAPAGFPGTAHATEHMMFRGSKGLDKDQLAEIGAKLGGEYNADTTETVTQYFYTAPADDLGVVLRIEALRMNGLSLNEADWDKERGAIEQEVSRDLSSPAYKYLSQLQAIMFAGTPYAHDALGTRPSFDKTDAKLLRHFYETWYAPNNAILVIAGDVDPQAALSQVKQAFGALPRKTLPGHAAFALAPVKAETLNLPTDYPYGIATIAYRMPGSTAKDFAAADILGDVLSSERGAFYGLVPSGDALAAQFLYRPKPAVGFGVAFTAFPRGGDADALLAKMRAVMADVVKNGVPADLVEAAKRREVAQIAERNDSISGLAQSWSNVLAFQGLDSPDALADAYRAVTVADVDRVAREVLNPDHAITAVLTPESSGKPISGKGFGGAESFASPPEKPVPLPEWANAALTALHLPPASPAPVVDTLPNGLRLIVQPEHVTSTVSVYGQIRQAPSLEEPKGQEGVATIVDRMFDYGSEQHDRLAFQAALDAIAADENAGATFTLKVQSAHFPAALSLLAENELHPVFPADAFAVVQKQTAGSLAGLLQSPDYLFGRAMLRGLVPANDPSLRQATPQTVMALTPADATAFYHRAFRPDLTTIVIVGDVTPEQARSEVEKTFGGWKNDGPTPRVDLPPVPLSGPSHAYVPNRSTLQANISLAETLGLKPDQPDHFTLTLGNEILGDGFSSRLYRDLRVKSGYVYSVSSRLNWGRTRSEYGISYGADPDNIAKARALAINDIKAMQNHPVSEDELTRAKASLLRQIPMGRASFDAIGQEYLHLADLGLPLNQPDLAAQHYFTTTAAELQAAFRQWLRPNDLAEVVEGPPDGH
ncbi:insulinase family protein [Acetobacteraceae bacterium KSS8]|uniref:Insulinase family protein n=1 Tax=Endosaccharibacter trunci TaxID=2812733 RepID=A0ABT1W8W5_9PROT|nr:insulinase family protein [Acetobacteraceae bacterium KSS8]